MPLFAVTKTTLSTVDQTNFATEKDLQTRHSRPPGRTAAAEALRWSPSPPFWRDSTAATPHGDLDPICRCPLFTLRGAERVPLLSREHGRISHEAWEFRLCSG